MASYEYKVKIGAESDIAKVVNADLKKAMSDAKSNKIKLEFDVASMEQAIETMKFLQTNNLGNKVSIDLDTQNFKDNLDALNAMSGKSATDIASQFRQNMEKAFSGTADKSLYDLLNKNFNADSLTRRIEDLKGQISSYKFDETDFVGMQSQAQRYLELIDLVKKAQTEIASGNLTGMTQEQLGQLVDVGKYEAQYESFTQSIGKLLAETEKFGKVKQNLEALKIEGDKASDYQKLASAVNEYAESLNKVEKANKVAVKGKDSSAQSQMLAELQNTITAYKNVQTIMSQMRSTYGEQTANSMISSLNIGKIDQSGINNIVGQYTASIDAFLNKLKGNGDITNGMRASLESLRAEVTQLDSSFAASNGMEAWLNKISSFSQKFTSQMKGLNAFQSSFGKLDQQLSKMGSFAQTEGKISKYGETVQGLKQELNNTFQGMMDGSMSPEKVVSSLDSIRERMEALKKTANSYNSVRGGKNLIESTIGKVQDLGDVEAYLRQYAEVQKLGTEIGKTVNTGKNNVTMTFQADTGEITKLSADMVQVGSAANNGAQGIAMMSSAMSGANASASGLSSSMSEVGNALAMYFSTWKLVSSAINEFKEGFNTFKELDTAMTNISYTMDVSKDQLQQFGESAVNMAKDLSMSVKDTESIYQIYANMNTSMSEIEQTAKPTAILANLSGEDASTAADQIQGIIQQFGMLDEAGSNAADVSMHIVDAMNDISANVAMDYGRGISVISDAVQAAGAVASDAGMSFEQLAAISAKAAERTRESGSTVGNAIKTITTRLTKVGKMPAYADEVSNEELSKASESLAQIGIQVYNADGSFREMDTVLGELAGKWDGLTDAQQANIAFNIAATRQTSQFRNILMAWTESMDLAAKATNAQGSAEANQQKYQESVAGQMQQIATQWDAFWLKVFQSDGVNVVLDFILNIVKGLNTLADTLGGTTTAFLTFMAALKGMGAIRDVILGLFTGKGLLGSGASGGGLLGGLVGGASKGGSKGGLLGTLLSPFIYGARGAKSLIGKASNGLKGIMETVVDKTTDRGLVTQLMEQGMLDSAMTTAELESAGYQMSVPLGQGLAAGMGAIAPVAIPAAILAGIGGVAAYAAYKDGEYDRNVEAFNESSQKFAADTSDLDSLKGKLSEVNSQIEQINSQGTLTLTDEVQLRNLMQQSKELERQIALKEQQQKIDEAKAKEDAQDLVKSDVKNYGTGQQQYMIGSGFKDVNPKTNVVDATESNLKVLEEYNKKIRDSNDEYDELMQKQANGVLSDAEETQLKELQTMRDEANEINSQVAEDMANLSSAKPFLDAATQARINAMEIQYAAKDATSSTEADLLKLQAKFEDGTDASMQRIKDYILETASSGQEAVSMMEQLGISMDSLNLVDSSNASRYFQDMIDSAKQAKESVDEVKEAVGNTFDAVKTASESANQGANWDELTNFYKNAKDLYEQGLVGTDDFQTLTALITPGKIDTSKFEYASDAYVEAWEKSREKAERYLNGEDAKGSMDNLLNDLIDVGKATRGADDEIAFNFDSTAEAAKALNAPIGVVEASLHKLEEYGAEFDGVEFSGEQLAQYSENLEGLKSLYDSMETSSTKDLLGKKIEGFETEYGELQEDLSQLSEEQIVKIKFEYDLASLQMDVENAIKDAVSNDTTESWAALSVTQQRERDYLEKNNKYDESKDSGYSSITERIKKNNEEMRKTQNDEDKKTIAQNNAMLAEMQNSFLEYNADGGKLGFNDWFQSDQALKSLDDLASQYGLTTDALRGMIVEAFDGQKSLVESSDRAIRDSRKNFQELQRDYKNSKKDLAESEKSSKYDETTADYSAATEKRKELRGNAKQARDSGDYTQAEYYQRQVNGIQQLQAKFQELQNTGSDISWTDFLKTDEYQGAINDILKETGMGRGELERILGVDLPPVHLEVEEGSIEDIKSELEYLGEDSTIEFEAELDDGSMANITASLDENGEVVYTANVDGVEQTVTPILHENGEITYDANLDKELEENGEVKFSANVDGVEQEVTAVKEEDGTVTYSANVDGVKTTLEELKTESGVIHFTTDLGNSNKKPKDVDQKVKRKVDDAETKKKPAPVDQKAIRKPDNSQTMSSPPPVTQTVKRTADNSSVSSSLPEIKQTVRRTVVNDSGGGGKGGGVGKATGTAYKGGGHSFARAVSGSAFASGNVDSDDFPTTWKTPIAGTSLVGELGREIVVDTDNSRWYTVGDNGAEFRKIPKNAIIFNNEQTEELLSNGSLNSASYAFGTAYAKGVKWPGSKSSSGSGSGSSSGSSKKSSRKKSGGGGGKSSGKSDSKSKDSSDNKKSKLEKYLENIFDWAEYRLKNLSSIADRYSKLADSAEVWSKKVRTATKTINGVQVEYTKGGAAQLYNKAIKTLNSQIAGTQKSIQGYQNFYNRIVKLSGLDGKTIKKIQDLTSAGQFDIQVFKGSGSDDDKKSKSSSKNKKLTAIENISKWYQKIIDTQSSIEDLMLQRAELAQKKLDAIEDIYGAKLSVYENTMKRDQAKMEYILNTSGVTGKYFKAGKSSVKSSKQTIQAAREEYQAFERQFNKQVENGTLVKGTKSYNTNKAKLRELETKIYEAMTDLQEQITGTFENIADHYEELRDRNDERLDVNEGNIDITKRNQRGYTSKRLRSLYGERNALQYNNLQLAAQELASQRANKKALISSNPKDVTAIKAADRAIEAANNKYKQAVIDYRQYLYDNKDEAIENIENYYDALEDYFSSIQDAVEANIDLKRTKGKVVTVGDYKSSIKAADDAAKVAKQRYNAVFKELKSQIEQGYITIGSEKYYQSLAKVNSMQKDMIDSESARADVYNQISQIKIDNIQSVIEGFENLNDTLSSYAELLNDMGNKRRTLGKVNEPYLRRQMGISEQTIYGYDRQRNTILSQMNGVEKYSDRWKDLNGQLQDANGNIIEAAKNMEEFADAIREIRWDKFNKGIETIDYTKTELSDLVDILNEDNFISKNGAFTIEGLAAIALQGQAIKENIEGIEAHRVALKKLKKEYDNNVISLDEYTEESREHMDAIRDGVSAYQDLRDSIVDLYLEALEKENELLQENIEKRREAIQRQQDYYSYQKTIRNDTKDIQYLQSQIAALNGVNNTNAQSKLASLRSQLADATEQYNDDKQNHYFDLMNQGYDKLVEDANKSMEDIEDTVRRSTEKQTEIIKEMLNTAGGEYKKVYDYINKTIKDNGIVLSNNTNKAVTSLGKSKTAITNVGLTYSNMTKQMKADSEAITGASGILTTTINKLGMTNSKLDQIVKKTASVKSGFTNINTEIGKITTSFNTASKSILKLASDSLAQIKKLTSAADNSVKKASSSSKKKTTTTKSSSSSLKGKDTSNKNIKNAKTVTASAAKNNKQTYSKAYVKDYAMAYIINNSKKTAPSLIKKAKYQLSKDVAAINGNKTLSNKQVEYLMGQVNKMLGKTGKDAISSATLYAMIKDNLKKLLSGKASVVSTGITKLADGSKKIDKKQLAITNEEGWEAIYRKSDGAILTPLNVGDKVFTNEMSERLWKLAQGNTLGADMVSKTASPVVNNVETYQPNITVSFENFMTVQGNVDKDVLGDLKNLKNEWMTDFSKHLTKEFGMLGNKRRFS